MKTARPDNPFVYGEIVSAGAFADREDERRRLAQDLAIGQKIFLISPRRYGKSSLIRSVMRELSRRGILTIVVTVAASSSYLGFLESYAQALVAADTPASRLRRWASELFRSVTPRVRFGQLGRGANRLFLDFPTVRSSREVARLAAEVYALPARIAARRRTRVAIALDEFQAIAAFDGGNVEQALRDAVQTQREVGYVFAGSEPTLMEQMLVSRRPFYKAGPVVRLEKIDPRVFAGFIASRFATSGVLIEADLADAMVELGGNVPYDVQRLAHETWDDVRSRGQRRADLEDLHRTLSRLLGEQQLVFEHAWQRLTLSQRAVLRAVVIEEGRELLSGDVRVRHRLAAPSSVQSALAALQRLDVVQRDHERYLVTDSLYREWVARQTS
ncbi:MAG: hypothetical protein ACT4QD_01545 [Acidobacteriota bacterium]